MRNGSMPKYSYIFIITSVLLYDMFPSIRYLGNTLKAQLTKTFFFKYWWSHNWHGPFNVNMVVVILILIYLMSILLTFAVPIHQFSTFLLRESDITSRYPFSFHNAKNISYVMCCDNCTALVVGLSMHIFPLAQSVRLLFENNKIQFIRK